MIQVWYIYHKTSRSVPYVRILSDTSCDHLLWIHPASHLNNKILQVLIVLKLNFFLNQKEIWIISTFHKQMFSLDTMTMNCSYYKRRMMHQMAISTIKTLLHTFTAFSPQLVFCSIKNCLIVESFESYDKVYFCCCLDCDHPPEHYNRYNLVTLSLSQGVCVWN